MIRGEALEGARRLLRRSASPAVLTGAGFSAECGIPIFRGPGGLWEGVRPETLATPEAFAADPEKVWRWYAWRRDTIDAASPHGGHHALVAWERRLGRLPIVTQNVDGLHQRSGSSEVLELHGSITRARCEACDRRVDDWRSAGAVPPRCVCGRLLRPDVVWFGEALPPRAIETATSWIASCDLLVVAGTSGVVAPAALLPGVAQQRGTPILEINPEKTPLSPLADAHIAGVAGVVLPELLRG